MSNTETDAQFLFNPQNNTYICRGYWTILKFGNLLQEFKQSKLPSSQKLTINGKDLIQFDSAGALALFNCVDALKKRENTVEFKDFNQQQNDLFNLVEEKKDIISYQPLKPKRAKTLESIGKETINKLQQVQGLVILIGDLAEKLLSACKHVHRFHFPSVVASIYETGVTALPIIGLLSFLIGVVLAYQMGLQLETYGANIFIAYLSGMAIFREFSPLITAIIVAGRTSSAFTAQIGSMKINEEIDALYTMGLSPTELLVIPKLLGLLIVFPLLIFWSVLFSTIGAMIMSKFMLNVGYMDFLSRLQSSVGFKQFLLGLYKAPIFAILIALVGCFQGFRVQLNADSLGTQTTKSVVQALFLIIIADAIYSIIYSWLDL